MVVLGWFSKFFFLLLALLTWPFGVFSFNRLLEGKSSGVSEVELVSVYSLHLWWRKYQRNSEKQMEVLAGFCVDLSCHVVNMLMYTYLFNTHLHKKAFSPGSYR